MNRFGSLVGPTRERVWRRLADEVGGQYLEATAVAQDAVQARVDDWIVTLASPFDHEALAAVRAPFFNPEKFRFTIYRTGFLTGIWTDVRWALNMQDAAAGRPSFDRAFVIKGNAAARVRALLERDGVRRLLEAQPRMRLWIRGPRQYPAGVEEICFTGAPSMRNLSRLRMLFELFAELLREFSHVGGVEDDAVQVHIRRLSLPGGRVKGQHLLYDGDEPRRDAAAALGRLGDPAAVPALAAALGDKDSRLAVLAMEALAEIGHGDAVGPLVRRLGDTGQAANGRPLRDHSADALRRLGEGALVDAVRAALRGDFARLRTYNGPYREEIVWALGDAITWRAGMNPANALVELRAVEALPRLREVLRRLGGQNPTGRTVSAAIERLEARASLPRSAAAQNDEDTLPRAAREPGRDTATLPRAPRRSSVKSQ